MKAKQGQQPHLIGHYATIYLPELDARVFVEQDKVFMYSMLPTMANAGVPLLKQALAAMKKHYRTREFGARLVRFQLMAKRSIILSEPEKEEIMEELKAHYNYDWFIDENPDVQERITRGKKEARKEGVVEEAQAMVLEALKESYPEVLSLAREQVTKIGDAARLRRLTIQILKAPDEATVLKLLHLPAA